MVPRALWVGPMSGRPVGEVTPTAVVPRRQLSRWLWGGFVVSVSIYATLLWMGPRYALEVPVVERPVLAVIGLYQLASGVYFLALAAAVRQASTARLAWWIVGTSITLRLVLLPTPPFQEIDLYRYLWDGAVVVAGVDPYRHPPQAVVNALDGALVEDSSLAELVELTEREPALGEIVRTVHYAELPTPYPPVSQAVFATAAVTTPNGWSSFARLVWLKAWLTAFDIATLLVVLGLLWHLKMPIGGALAYGWCPLVLKEIAGSGHLDAIATFFTTAAVAMGVIAVTRRHGTGAALGASVLLGLGVGAKLYPVALAPWLAAGLLVRLGWRTTLAGATVFLLTSVATLWPMFGPTFNRHAATTPRATATDSLRADSLKTELLSTVEGPSDRTVLANGVESIPPPPSETIATTSDKTDGIAAFLSEWEINDLLFMVVYENLRWHDDVSAEQLPWFDITPRSWSEAFQGKDGNAFLATRAATGLFVVCLAFAFAVTTARHLDGESTTASAWVRGAFLTLAWFWLLSPTQNPWYWCWVVPLLPWTSSRAWLAMSAAVLLYYLRFWLETAYPAAGVAGTPYDGEDFFYYVVPWIEFGPLLAWLAVETFLGWQTNRCLVLALPRTAKGGIE